MCSYVCILFAFISHFLKLVVYMLGYVPYITTGFTGFRKPLIIQWRKVFKIGLRSVVQWSFNNVFWVHFSTSIMVKIVSPWLTLVASFLETPHIYIYEWPYYANPGCPPRSVLVSTSIYTVYSRYACDSERWWWLFTMLGLCGWSSHMQQQSLCHTTIYRSPLQILFW